MVAATVGAKTMWGETILTSGWGVVLFISGGGGAAYGEDAHKDDWQLELADLKEVQWGWSQFSHQLCP